MRHTGRNAALNRKLSAALTVIQMDDIWTARMNDKIYELEAECDYLRRQLNQRFVLAGRN